MIENLRFAFRTFRNNPSFTAIIMVILALGIGFNSAVFSIVYEVLLNVNPCDCLPGRLNPV